MSITSQTEYAVMLLSELARRPGGSLVSSHEVACKYGVSDIFLKKTAHILVNAGLVYSRRGTGGGIGLTRPAETITLGEVIEAVQGPLLLKPCLQPGFPCGRRDGCQLWPRLRKMQVQLEEELNRVVITELV